MDIKDFIQYPLEVASSMIHVESRSGNVNFSFSSDQFWDLTSDRHHISFCVLQTAAGQVDASLHCQKNMLSKTSNKVQSLDAYPVGWSRIFEDQYFSGSFTDVCINSDLKLVFCSKQAAQIGSIRASWSEEVPVFVTSQSASNYQQSERILNLEAFPIFVPFNSNSKKILNSSDFIRSVNTINPQDFLIDTVLPVIGSLAFSPDVFLVPNNQILELLTPILGSKVRLISKGCHKKLAFLPTTGSYNLVSMKKYGSYNQALAIHIKFLSSFSKETFLRIKQFYSMSKLGSDEKQFDIVMDKLSSQFMNSLKENLSPTTNIFVIDDNYNFTYISKIISAAKVVIASDFKTLFFGSLMNEDSTLIEIIPDGMNCFNFQKMLGNKIDAKYKILENKHKQCKCKDFNNLECYLKHHHKYDYVDKQALLDMVKDLLD